MEMCLGARLHELKSDSRVAGHHSKCAPDCRCLSSVLLYAGYSPTSPAYSPTSPGTPCTWLGLGLVASKFLTQHGHFYIARASAKGYVLVCVCQLPMKSAYLGH